MFSKTGLRKLRSLIERGASFFAVFALFFFFGTTQVFANLGSYQDPDLGAGNDSTGLQNPLNPHYSSIQGFIAGALMVLVEIALPILALAIVYSGFMFAAARGNPAKLQKARQNFLYVIIGAILILGAWVIANLIQGTVSQLLG